MTNRHPLYLVLALILTVAGVGCNSDSYYYSDADITSAAITKFALKENDSVLRNLDSVFFSIDLIGGRIFNADSLPKGTDISRLQITVGTPAISVCNVTYRQRGEGRDTTVSYLASPNDSINFAAGPVKITVVSSDGLTTRDYTVQINVHRVDADTLYWDKMAMRGLPSGDSAPARQKTVDFRGTTLCLTANADGSKAWLAQSADMLADAWTTAEIQLPAGADVRSFTATDDALYILGGDGMLYRSTSAEAPVWQSTATKMNYIYGAYGSRLLGNAVSTAGNYEFVTYPATATAPVPADCPVSGTSNMLSYSSAWSAKPIAMTLGGKLASGKYSGAMWGYDGTTWAKITSVAVPEGEGIAICRYPVFRFSETSWTARQVDAILAIGGRSDDGKVDELVYMSIDEGITWKPASDYLLLPDYIAARAEADLMVRTFKLHYTEPGEGWTPFPTTQLPPWAITLAPDGRSRVSQPITEWECPYIFMFGGVDNSGKLYNQLWRGVINRLTFNPLY